MLFRSVSQSRYESDYDLLKIGEYYEDSGTIIPCDVSVLVHGRDVPRPD